MKKNYIIIDTNVFISAIIGQNNFPRKIFDEIVLLNEMKICLSAQVLTEYQEVSCRDKFSKFKGFKERALTLIEKIKKIALFFEPQEKIVFLSDKDDDMFLELAVEANANYLVSGNTRDFTMKEFRGISILTPKEFYEEWQEMNNNE